MFSFILFLEFFTKTGLCAPAWNNSYSWSDRPAEIHRKAEQLFMNKVRISSKCMMRFSEIEIKVDGCRPKVIQTAACEGHCFSIFRLSSKEELKLMKCSVCLPSKVVYSNTTLTCGDDGYHRNFSHPVIISCRCEVIDCGY